MSKLYAIVFTESGEILDAASFKKYWPNYGSAPSSGIYGWRKPKKIYDTIGKAKAGFAHVPHEMKPHLSIAEFGFEKNIIDGVSLGKEQEEKRLIKIQKSAERAAKWKLERAKAQLEEAQKEINKLSNGPR